MKPTLLLLMAMMVVGCGHKESVPTKPTPNPFCEDSLGHVESVDMTQDGWDYVHVVTGSLVIAEDSRNPHLIDKNLSTHFKPGDTVSIEYCDLGAPTK